MRLTLPPRGRRAKQALAVGAAPALVIGIALVAVSNPATASHTTNHSATPSDQGRSVTVSKSISSADSRTARVEEYWTPERMANAVSADRLAPEAPDGESTAQARTDAMKPTTASRPVLPSGVSDSARKVRKSKTIGKVFFTTKGGTNMVCSGSAVNSKAKNMVMTAGHCVHGGKGKGWYTKNWAFVPGYGPGSRTPNGIYPMERLVALQGWVKHSNFNHDVAIALVKPGRGTNKQLVKKVGGFGTQFGKSRHRRLTAVGYSAVGFKGDKQKHCRKKTHRLGRGQIEMRCKVLTGGASGGPWVKGKVAKGKGYINGVNSNVNRAKHPTVVRSTYFDREIYRMYKKYRNNKG